MQNSKPIYYKVPFDPSESPYTIQGTTHKIVAPRCPIPNMDSILVTDANGKARRERIRYIDGLDTLKVEEQKKLGIDDKYQQNDIEKSDLLMTNGFIVVYPDQKPMLAEYLKITNRNGSNPNRDKQFSPLFVLDDREAQVEEKIVDIDRMYNALKMIDELRDGGTKLKPKGRKLGTILGYGEGYEDRDVIAGLQKIAKEKPNALISAYKSLTDDSADLISEAERYNIISISATKVVLTSTEQTIASFKVGKGGKKGFTEFLSQAENSDTLKLLEQAVMDAKVELKQTV